MGASPSKKSTAIKLLETRTVPYELEQYQREAVRRFKDIITTKALSSNCKNSRENVAIAAIEPKGAIVNFTTGGGKTITALGIAKALIDDTKLKVSNIVILVPTVTLAEQWYDQFTIESNNIVYTKDGILTKQIPSSVAGIIWDKNSNVSGSSNNSSNGNDGRASSDEEKSNKPKRCLYVNNNVKVQIYTYDNYAHQEKAIEGTTIFILDEIQNIYGVVTTTTPELLRAIIKNSDYVIGLTATPVIDNIMELMYAIHAVAKPSEALSSTFPLSSNQLRRVYSDTNLFKSIIYGYIGPLLNTRIKGGLILIVFVFGSLDYYALQDLKIRKRRVNFINELFSKFNPVFSQNVGRKGETTVKALKEFDFTWEAVKRVYSNWLFYAMLDPYHIVIPTVIGALAMSNPGTRISAYNFDRLAQAVEPFLIKRKETTVLDNGSLKYWADKRVRDNILASALPGHQDNLYEIIDATSDMPTIEIVARKVNYSALNAKTLYHLSTRMLTKTELTLMYGRHFTQQQYESHWLVQGVDTNPLRIMKRGRMIGNLTYSKQDVQAIEAEYVARVKNQARALGLNEILAKYSRKETDTADKSRRDSTFSKLFGTRPNNKFLPNTKFNGIMKRIEKMLKMEKYSNSGNFRVAIFSEYWEGTELLHEYITHDVEFQDVLLSIQILPRLPRKNAETNENSPYKDTLAEYINEYNLEYIPTPRKIVRIIVLGPGYAEGFDGINKTNVMFILEPILSYPRLLQIRGRIARKKTHDDAHVKEVLIVELVSTLDYYRTTFLRFFNKDRARIHRDTEAYVIPGMENLLTDQKITPDEQIYAIQQSSRKLDVAIIKQAEKCGDLIDIDTNKVVTI